MMKRREFLIGSAIAAGPAAKGWGQSPDRAKLDRIAIMTLCFSRVLKSAAHPDDQGALYGDVGAAWRAHTG